MSYCYRPFRKNLPKKGNWCDRLRLLVLSVTFPFCLPAAGLPGLNANSLLNLNRGMQAFGFRTQNQWDEINARLVQPYYFSEFTPGDTSVVEYLFYPYWQGNLYKNYHFRNIKRLGYLGYLINPENGEPDLTYSWTVSNVIEYSKPAGTKADLILFCQGTDETSRFLSSPEARQKCVQRVKELTNNRSAFSVADSSVPKLYNADGINVYFADFNFKGKRDFGLFIKELYMTYSYQKDSVKLIVTFPMRDTVQYNYLKSIGMYIDELYFADYDYRGMLFEPALTTQYHNKYLGQKDELSIFREIPAEIRLAEFKNPFKCGTWQEALDDWSTYLLAICAVWVIIFVTLFFYFFWGKANQFINENLSFFILIAALLVCETLIMFVFMVEEMNYTTLLINVNNPGSYYFLLVPLILVFIFPISRLIQSRRHLP